MQTFTDNAVKAQCEREVVTSRHAIAPDNAFTIAYFFKTVKDWHPTLEINVTLNATSVVLCTRVGIMVGGGLKCLGSVQHLKHRFGDGLMFDAKLLPAPVSEVESLVLRHFDSLDARISALELSDVCRRFGESAWEEKLVETHPTGFLMASALRRDGYVLAGSFASWWLTEVRFAGVERSLSSNFARVELLERQNESCRFKLHDVAIGDRVALSRLSLGHVFGLLESSKASLAIREYSVSQTTLEQIFNIFVSQPVSCCVRRRASVRRNFVVSCQRESFISS
ncbi:hypothetical protein Poli38472_000032 [Pythium oligandrum]|uniref:Uncharacterized protein n=1 Tax=Pythium oligandrum TaxID=41045 RepID=A0A8K1CBX9_PYTOL|nr:hypothetical protein Poli38472_000032 [Pythium oligandrum]|eukprot:TMW59990.1 hypothetical protein Poli38472_000032 [Pythium oligandrum]